MKVIGKPRRRVDGRAKVTGQTRFADDIVLPRMLHMKLLRSPHPHALIKNVDIEKLKGPQTQVVDFGGHFVMPGFNDAHMHLVDAGLQKLNVDLTGVKSLDEMRERVLQALRGTTLTAEVTPHNLTLDEADFLRLGVVAKVAPPLRPRPDVTALRAALAAGALDVVATDHAPHHPDEKAAGATDIWKAPGGFPGVQTFLPLMLRLVDEGIIEQAALVRTCCAHPARLFGLYPRKGALQVGSDADLVIVDPGRPFTIRNRDQLSKARNVPFDGLTASASPILACLRGTVIMRDGQPTAPPIGEFLRP